MIFKAPAMLLLLAVLPLLGKLLIRARKKQDEAAARLRGPKKDSAGWKNRIALQLIALSALILALAQPAWNPHPGPAGMQGRDLVIALDISRSMLAADVFPDRLGEAKIALFESLDHLHGQRIGLITFAGAASVRVPLTLDHNFVRYMLDRAQPSDADVGSTSIQSAIEKAIDVVLKESEKGKQDLIIITDGEDLLSDIEQTAEELRECGARVLIIGIGDPIAGARIPDLENPDEWMMYEDEEVVTRLDEAKLNQLDEKCPNVTYYPAQTRPFDLTAIYRQMLADTTGIPGTESGQIIYTEGYPWLIALGLALFFLPINRRVLPALAALLIVGWSNDSPDLSKNYQQDTEQGNTLWTEAQTSIETDPRAALLVLTNAREKFLHAALIRPGDMPAAKKIAGISAQIRAVEQAILKQEKEEQDLQEKLQAALEELKQLTARETALSQQSQKLLRRRPVVPLEEKTAAIPPAITEQTDIGDGTARVLGVIQEVQAVIQKMLTAAFGETETPPPTEFDEPVQKLSIARSEQQNSLQNLTSDAPSWVQANSSLLSASRRMQEALALLSDQGNNNSSDEGSEDFDDSDWDFDEEMEWAESDSAASMSLPMSSQDFKTALENKALPSPNYTAEEILAEEAANMEKRAEQKASQAGSNVEKNW